MSSALFPRSFISTHHPDSRSPSTFHPLFRLLDDFDHHYSRNDDKSSIMKSFTPKFDVKETKDAYELHGDLPGIEQNNITIEFTDADTLIVKGRVERSYTAGKPPAGAIESSTPPAAIKDKQPTVEDEREVTGEIAKEEPEQSKPNEPGEKYWVSERSVGEFARSFTFPVRVDQEKVWAEMKNGVLSVVVPKAKKVEGRKITIN